MSLRDLPLQELPRERLLKQGAEALSLVELLAIVIRTGTRGKTVLELSAELVRKFGALDRLLEASISELSSVKGMGKTKAIQLKAAFALVQRYLEQQKTSEEIVTSFVAYNLVKEKLSHQKKEHIVVVLKDVKGKLIACETVSIGTLSEVLVHPREVFYPAVRHMAHSFILAHNHPSGDPVPSAADLKVTRLLLQSAKIMGIHLDDHLIVGAGRHVSLKEGGYFATHSSSMI